jgi:ATP-dependent Lon protease
MSSKKARSMIELPVLPLRDVVVYPHMVIPLFVGRNRSIKALDECMKDDKRIILVAQKDADIDNPNPDDLYRHGVVGTILQLLKLPDGTIKVLVEGLERIKIERFHDFNAMLMAEASYVPETTAMTTQIEALQRSLLATFDRYVKLNKKIPPEVLTTISSITDPNRVADAVAAHVGLKMSDKQIVLEIPTLTKRIERLLGFVESEIDLLQAERRIRGRVKSQMEKTQREYYLNEQMKAIQKELTNTDDDNDLGNLLKKIDKAGMPKEALKKAKTELSRLKMMPPMSAEATVSRSYLDWLLNVPWKAQSTVNRDLTKAEAVLDKGHYGLDKVKERILEYLAVEQRVDKLKGPILCLVGPPGVGKTSLGRSMADATGREFARVALGGVRDEAEIRGHRRTYVGALPGKVIQKMAKVEVKNPLFMLDEIDKMSADFRGDPASALLEVLDPEQNHLFNDHFLEVDYDLSDVMFVATANTLDIPLPLMDRMEVIRLSGYTEDEKIHIAGLHLIPKQLELNGLRKSELTISNAVVRDIIRYYTREAGVRNLEREISKVCRKVVKAILLAKRKKKQTVTCKNLDDYLGVRHFSFGQIDKNNQIGQVTGLAWTQVGGEILTIEAAMMPGKGKAKITGKLGDVMQESVQAALTVVQSRYQRLDIDANFFEKHDLHVHVPEGATPKDGPSAGIAMCTALVSLIKQIPVKSNVAMTGEITLRGEVLPIGGLKEKLIAARASGIKTVIIPYENAKDLVEIPDNVKRDLDIHPVRWIEEVLELALTDMPESIKMKPRRYKSVQKAKTSRARKLTHA